MFRSAVVAVLLIGLSTCQEWFPLSKLSSGVKSLMDDLEVGSNLYVISNDPADLLMSITIKSGNISRTAFELAHLVKEGTGLKLPWTLDTDLVTLSTNNTDDDVKTLNGHIYVTTAKQANDSTFSVYDGNIKSSTSFNSQASTIVVLNVNLDDFTNSISAIKQDQNSSISLYAGLPSDNIDTSADFFHNPVSIPSDGRTILFNNVDPIQIDYLSYYIVATGPFEFSNSLIKPNVDPINSTASTSTGLLLLTDNTATTANRTINLSTDSQNNITTGYIFNAKLSNALNITLYQGDNVVKQTQYNGTVNHTHVTISDQHIDRIEVTLLSGKVGTYALQYFNIDNTDLARTTPVPTTQSTTTTVQTTTNSAGLQEIVLSLIAVVSVRFL